MKHHISCHILKELYSCLDQIELHFNVRVVCFK